MKLFVITSRFPYPLEKGDKLRLYYQLKELSNEFDVYLAAISHKSIPDKDLKHVASLVKEVRVYRMSKLRAFVSVLINTFLLKKLPAQCAYFYSQTLRNRIHKWMDEVRPDRTYYQLIRTLYYQHANFDKSVIDLMDAFSIGASIRASNSKGLLKLFWVGEARRVAAFEKRALNEFREATIISDLDKERIGGSSNITVVNNGIDDRFFADRNDKLQSFDAVFVGNLGYYPNVKAVQYIADQIIPSMCEINPGFKVNIVGPNKEKVSKFASDSLIISGWYDDVTEAYHSGRIFLAPLFEGIGQQNKILEAMALGIPCITTPDVAQALMLEDRKHVIIANRVEAFCTAINELLSDVSTYRSLQANASRYVAETYKWGSVTKPLIDLLKKDN